MTRFSYRAYFLGVLAVFALIFIGLSSLSHGPKPKKIDVPQDQFSANRAFSELSDFIADNQPHPSGSAGNKAYLEMLVNKFKALGYESEIQKTLACTHHYPGCTQVENFITVLKGTGSGDAILLTTHYDSVPAGPGAGDAGSGVAALIEIARILKAESKGINDVIFLITDGEEGGLRGASGFANEHPMIKNVKLVVNLEARGASGPSTMFETSAGNSRIIKTYATATRRPVANSLSYEIYKRLPNDTDYSVYKKMGVAGLNYAFTGDVALYHSARDDLEHLDKSSLQHHGDNALSAVRAFINEDLNQIKSKGDATYFDVFGIWLVNWSSWLNIPLSLLTMPIMIFAIYKIGTSWRQGFLAVGFIVSVLLLTPAIGWLLSFPLGRWPQLFYLDHPYPWPGRLALLFGAGLAPWVISILAGRLQATIYNMLICAIGALFALLSLLIAILMSGTSYLLLVPALAVAIGCLFDIWRKHERYTWATHLGLLATAYMAFYHFIALEVILHYRLSHFRILPLILPGLILLPIFMKARGQDRNTHNILGISMFALMAVTAIISVFMPGFNETHPRGQNLVYVQDTDSGKAEWISEGIGGQDNTFLAAAGFENTENTILPYQLFRAHTVSKPALNKNYPGATHILRYNEVDNAGMREVLIEVTSQNQGFELGLAFNVGGAPDTIRVNGKSAADYTKKAYWRPFTLRGPGSETYLIILRGKADRFTQMALIDTFSLAHNHLDGMAEMRPKDSAELHSGDRAHIVSRIDFQ